MRHTRPRSTGDRHRGPARHSWRSVVFTATKAELHPRTGERVGEGPGRRVERRSMVSEPGAPTCGWTGAGHRVRNEATLHGAIVEHPCTHCWRCYRAAVPHSRSPRIRRTEPPQEAWRSGLFRVLSAARVSISPPWDLGSTSDIQTTAHRYPYFSGDSGALWRNGDSIAVPSCHSHLIGRASEHSSVLPNDVALRRASNQP